MESPRVYDVVVFGATGFTGQRVLRELVSQHRGYVFPARRLNVPERITTLLPSDRRRYAAAGRSQDRLTQVLRDVSNAEVDVRKHICRS